MSGLVVYVAGASSEVEQARSYMTQLRAHGVAISHDWTDSVLAARGAGQSNETLALHEQASKAVDDRGGVREAHVTWLLAPTPPASTINGWVELGIAIGSYRVTVVSGPGQIGCIFASLTSYRFASHAVAIDHIVEMNERQRW